MENPTTQPAATGEREDERKEWTPPAVTDYEIDETTQNGAPPNARTGDGVSSYS